MNTLKSIFYRIKLFRRTDGGILMELFLTNAVASIVIIRVYLHLTNYPQLGGNGLHIAHMLWGGLLMLIALAILSFFLNEPARYISAIIGGLGFGTFIDELGKFITADNDYFFKPTFALIYLIFISLLYIFRLLFERRTFSPNEYLANALELLKDAATTDIDQHKKTLLIQYLDNAQLPPSARKNFDKIIQHIRVKRKNHPDLYIRIKTQLITIYHTFLTKRTFLIGVSFLFVVRALIFICFISYELFFSTNIIHTVEKAFVEFNFFDWGLILSSTASDILIIIGLTKIRRSYGAALMYFKYSIIVSIFFYQFFSFYHNQLFAFIGVVIDILLLYALNFMIDQRKE